MRNSAHLLAIASLILAIGTASAPVRAGDLNDYPQLERRATTKNNENHSVCDRFVRDGGRPAETPTIS